MPYEWIPTEKLNKIPDKTKQEIVAAVREGSKYLRVFHNGIVIIFGETHMAHRKGNSRIWDIEWKACRIAEKTGADYDEVRERFMQEMKELRFISGV